jgi:hypothetical protein
MTVKNPFTISEVVERAAKLQHDIQEVVRDGQKDLQRMGVVADIHIENLSVNTIGTNQPVYVVSVEVKL